MTFKKSVIGSVAAVALTVGAAFASVPAQTNSCSYMFNANLRLGAVSTDVQNLQKLLNMDAATKVASTGAGSMGYETLRFGPATFAAVKKFQAANAISPVSGYVGPLTRAALNTICTGNGNQSNTNTNTGSGVSSNSIPVSVLVQGQAGAKLGEFVVTGNGMVTNITLQRTGLSNNSTLANVYLYDGMTRLTDANSVRTDGSISFNAPSGLFMVNGSKTITVRADLPVGCTSTNVPSGCVNTSGQTVGVALTNVTMMGGQATPVTGVNGPLFSISSASTATANFTGSVSPATTYTQSSPLEVNAGSVNQTLWSKSISVSTNKVMLKGITFKQIGSAPMNALSNVQLYVDGVSKGAASINSMNQYVFAMAPVELTTGSHVIEMRGDVVAGSDRNFYMSIEESTDVMVEDSTLPGVGVTVTDGGSSSILLNSAAGVIKVKNGSLTVAQDTAFNNTTTLVGGATNVKLASFKITAYGEDVKVNTLKVKANLTGMSPVATTLANVGLYVNGSQAGSNQTADTSVNSGIITFSGLGSNLYIPAGTSVIVDVRGDVMSSGNVNYTAGTVKFDIDSNTSNAQGISSSQLTSTANQAGQTLTIASSNVTVAYTTGFGTTQTKAPNQAGVKVGSITVQTGSAESVNVTSFAITLAGNVPSNNRATNLTIKDGNDVIGTPIGNPVTGANNFSTNLTIPMSTTKVFDVYADLNTPNTLGDTMTVTGTVTYRGNTSNVSTTPTTSGSAMVTTVNTAAIGTGDITFVAGSSLSAQNVIAGQSGLAIGTFNIKSTSNIGGATLKDVTFTGLTNVETVTVNGKTASVVGTSATIYDVNIAVPGSASGVDVPVTVKLVCATTGGGCSGTSNSNVSVTWGLTTYNNGSTIASVTPSSATTATHKLVATKPTLTQGTGANGLVVGSEVKIGEVTIAADAAGNIKVNDIKFTSTMSGITGGTLSPTAGHFRIADGNVTVTGSACTVSGSDTTCEFGTTSNTDNDGYQINAGTSKTLTLFGRLSAGTLGNAGQSSISTTVAGNAAQFSWDDVNGGVTNIDGSAIYNFPTGSYVKTN